MSFLPTIVPRLKATVLANEFVAKSPKLIKILDHPAGPFTIHFWAPTFKWGISLANIVDMKRNPDTISTPQQSGIFLVLNSLQPNADFLTRYRFVAVALTGLIWSRYSVVINPVNYNLLSVNVFMAGTGLAQLYRKYQWNNNGGREAYEKKKQAKAE